MRSLRQVRQYKLPGSPCRWRFWEAHGPGTDTFAGEVAEHRCNGEHVWIARETPDGMTWMIDQDPATLLEVIDRLPGGLYDWVFEQTLGAVGTRLRPSDGSVAPELAIGRDDDELLMDGVSSRRSTICWWSSCGWCTQATCWPLGSASTPPAASQAS